MFENRHIRRGRGLRTTLISPTMIPIEPGMEASPRCIERRRDAQSSAVYPDHGIYSTTARILGYTTIMTYS